MTGFSPEWLCLREPVDHSSIAKDVRARLIKHVEGLETLSITDLGSGSGSSLRGLAPFLPQHQIWRLVDYDPELLNHARKALTKWADSARQDDGILHLGHNGKDILVHFVQADLGAGVSAEVITGVNLVSASAFFDLVSEDWICKLCDALARHNLPVYATLTYDGIEEWRPAHAADRAMLQAFHADQHRDKGFGPAAGPDAARILEMKLAARGFEISTGDSSWRLGRRQANLIATLAHGAAAAVAATGMVPLSDVDNWRSARSNATSCTIGHKDVFAIPAR